MFAQIAGPGSEAAGNNILIFPGPWFLYFDGFCCGSIFLGISLVIFRLSFLEVSGFSVESILVTGVVSILVESPALADMLPLHADVHRINTIAITGRSMYLFIVEKF
jgi:hypothetical protein